MLTYETEVTNDVLGFLTEEDVDRFLIQIHGLEVSEELAARIEEQIAECQQAKAVNEDDEEFEEILPQAPQNKESASLLA